MRGILVCAMALALCAPAFAAYNNSGNAPAFLWIDLCTNGIGDQDGGVGIPRMEPDVLDIGVDFGADGTVDHWLSQEGAAFLGRDNADAILPGAWRRFYLRLDQYAGQQAVIRVVDNSEEYYMAIESIRLNCSDGIVVPNGVPNGDFEDETPLAGWNIVSGSITDPAALIASDPNSDFTVFGNQFLTTRTDPAGTDNSETVVVESDPFAFEAVTSFVYGMTSGGASEFWTKEGAGGSDNASGVFIDIADTADGLNHQYDEGVDVPLVYFYGGDIAGVRNQHHPVIINTSGLEGKYASVVAIDDSEFYHIGLDSWRMNWDVDAIANGGFDDGIPTPEEEPEAAEWFGELALEYVEHPSGGLPGWTVERTGDASVYFFDKAVHGSMFSGRTYVGTAGFGDVDRVLTGVKIYSDPFVIQPVPDPAQSVFVQFASAQGSARERYTADGSSREWGTVRMQVDVDGNGEFNGDADYEYVQIHQGMGHNLNTSNMDLWQYPEYRFYVRPEHQGLQARFFVQDTMGPSRGSYGWMCVDDFYVWDGSEARLAFENSDFENGDLTNWEEETNINGGQLNSWLSGSFDSFLDGLVEHLSMNNRHTVVDGAFSADSAPNEYAGGDAGTGTLTSVWFELPAAGSNVGQWAIY